MRKVLFGLVGLLGSVALTACSDDAETLLAPEFELVSDDTSTPAAPKEEKAPLPATPPPSVATPDRAPPTSPTVDAGTPTMEAAPALPPGDYVGLLGATAPRSFGTAERCRYTVVMKDVGVALRIDGDKVAAAVVKSTMVERPIGSCPIPTIPDNRHSFALAAPTSLGPLAEGTKKTLLMVGTNDMAPKTLLRMEIEKKTDGLVATLHWLRGDLAGTPYWWTTTATVKVEPR